MMRKVGLVNRCFSQIRDYGGVNERMVGVKSTRNESLVFSTVTETPWRGIEKLENSFTQFSYDWHLRIHRWSFIFEFCVCRDFFKCNESIDLKRWHLQVYCSTFSDAFFFHCFIWRMKSLTLNHFLMYF